MTTKGRERRDLLDKYIIEEQLGDWSARAKLVDERPDLLPPAKYAMNTVQREITAIRKANTSSDTPEAQYIANLYLQLDACNRALATAPTSTLLQRAAQLNRDIAFAQGIIPPTRRAGGRKKGGKSWAPPAGRPVSSGPTTPDTTAKKRDAGRTPVDLEGTIGGFPAQEIKAMMDRWYPNGEPAKEGGP